LVDQDGSRIPDEVAYGRLWMRDRQNHWWQDFGMQDAGWTYEFFDGSLLLHDDVSFADGLVQPNGPGYQALIVYQSALDPEVAAKLLDWARQGLKVLLVHGARELKHLMDGLYTSHDRAAACTPGLDGRDKELIATIAELLSLPSVAETDDPANTVDALRKLGVVGRAEFASENRSVLSHLREDGEMLLLYLYHFLYETEEPVEVEVTLPGVGAVHRIDAWTGAVRSHAGFRHDGERTIVTVTLAPGETALLALDRSTAKSPESTPAALETVAEIPEWTVALESWDAGGLTLITEDRGLGYETREVRPTTAVTRIDAATGPLRPWKDIPEIGPQVSGIGEYTARLDLDDEPEGHRYILDLGSTAGGLGSVRVNDGEARGFDTSAPTIDVTDDLRAGTNTLSIRVSSSLNNRLLARGYYDKVFDIITKLAGLEPAMQTTEVRTHGLLGPVRLLRELVSRP
jgi:hypothetical protein